MPALYRLLTFRTLWQRWERSALIIASIALGVATLVSSRILNECLGSASERSTTPVGMGDIFINNGEFGVQRSITDEVREAKIPGVKSIFPLVVEKVTFPDLDNRKGVLVGAELKQSLASQDESLQQLFHEDAALGIHFTRTMEMTYKNVLLAVKYRLVVVGKSLYDGWQSSRKDLDDPLILRYGSQTLECLPIGYIEYDDTSPLAPLGGNVIGMELGQAARLIQPRPLPEMQAFLGGVGNEIVWEMIVPERINRIDVTLEPGANRDAVQASLTELVGNRARIDNLETKGQSTREIVSGMQLGFLLCSASAMIVGLFLVYNALSVTVAERRHDIGILRSVGATRFQILMMFTLSALVLGIVGAICGVPLGVGIARVILEQFREELAAMFLPGQSAPFWPTWETVVLAMVAGIVTSVCAALIPALQAAAQDPADAVRRVPGVAGGVWKLAHQATCVVLVAGGIALILTRHELPPRVGAFGGMMAALIGLLLAAPILVGILVRLVHPILRAILPIEARLAADNLLRSPGRTGIVIGALGAGVAVMIQTAGVGRSNEEPIVQWLDEVIQADQFVFGGSLTEATSSQTPMQREDVEGLRKLPGVAGVAGLRYVRPEFNGTVIFLTALDAQVYAEQTSLKAGDELEGLTKVRKLTGPRDVIVSDNFILRHNVQTGDTILLPGPDGPVELHIVDTLRDYSWSRGTIYIDRTAYTKLFQDPKIDVAHVYLDADADRKVVQTFAENRGLIVQDRSTVRSFLADLIERLYTLAYLQQIIVGIVASLGVVTALLISVLQRKRELGLLLAVGATPGQVIRSVIAEALLMGIFGTVLGILIGLPMEWYILRVIMVEESGFVFDLLIPWKEGLGIAVGAIVVAGLAGLLPAWHAVRVSIPEAIAYE